MCMQLFRFFPCWRASEAVWRCEFDCAITEHITHLLMQYGNEEVFALLLQELISVYYVEHKFFFSPIFFCRRKHGINKRTNSHVCIHIYVYTHLQWHKPFDETLFKQLLCHLYWTLGIRPGHWVCSQWGGQRLALLDNFSPLTHAAAFCNLNTQKFQLLLSQCKAYGIVMWIWDSSLRTGHQCHGGWLYSGVELNWV